MESYRVQQAINAGITQMSSNTGQQQAIINGDFFAAFLQLITQGSKDGENPLSFLNGTGENTEEGLLQLFNPSKDGEESENLDAMQLMAGLLNANTGYNLLYGDNIKNAIENLTADSNMQVSASGAGGDRQINANFLNELLLSQTESETGFTNSLLESTLNSAIPNVLPTQQKNPVLQNIIDRLDKLNQQAQQPLAEGEAKTELALINTVNENSNSQKTSSETLFNGDMSFKNSVAQAQKLIKNQTKTDSAKETTSETIPQQQVQQPKFEAVLQDKTVLAPKQEVDLEDLSSQIKNNLSSGAVFDKKEFSVKLKPEGLGEVVVKLVSEQNKITMSIVTATNEAAKALNDKLPTLRETMRDMQVEVRDVVSNGSQENFNSLYQQNQQQNQFTDNRHFTNSRSYGGDIAGENEQELQDQPTVHYENERRYMYA